jgi:hypothetical protein
MVTLTPQLVTRYHVGLATTDWLRGLETHVGRSIACHPEYRSSSGRGTVASQYNEERFMGELSLIKNDFAVIVHVSRHWSIRKDRYEATVRYAPESNTFKTLRETVETLETKARDKRNHGLVTRFVNRIENGCHRNIVDDWRCPWCDSIIDVSFHRSGNVFAVSCPNGHFHRHEGTDSPPAWWREAVTDGWLECGAMDPTEQ